MRIVLEQKQTLNMVMTTELRQAIELLQLSTYELRQFIQKQTEENPFIELVEKESMNFSYPRRSTNRDEIDPIDFAASYHKTMHEQLLEQTINFELDEQTNELVRYLILNINDEGYLTVSVEEACKQLDVEIEAIEKALKIVHQLEPSGIGARNFAECLAIQAKKKYPEHTLLLSVINNYLQTLANKKWDTIAKELDISLAKVNEIFETIKTLNPRPVTHLAPSEAEYVSPDITIKKQEKENVFTISLNDYYIPELRFNHTYSNELQNTPELSRYVDNHFKKFQWLRNSIEQRRSTILKIMEVIVNRQHNFLISGSPTDLKPLTLRDIATEIEMHESTVSRATTNKLVETPVGTFDLRYFFSTKLSNKSGDDASQTKVKAIIEQLISEEDKYKPLSDQKIADRLKKEKGIVISRRTVAKYRDELQIPSSTKRKEIKIS